MRTIGCLAILALVGCGSAPSPLATAEPPRPSELATLAAAPSPAGPPSTCPVEFPSQVAARASLLHVPPASVERALLPVLGALCACTKGGEHLDVSAKILASSGEVRASASGSPAIDACLSRRLDPGHFEPFDSGAPPCTDCGPHRLGAPARPERMTSFVITNGASTASPAPSAAAPALHEAPIVIPFSYDRPSP